ncbi:MAG: caspase family protein [Acidobacteria bacterium]|nr:caspase family protein [Acidobacteriota bacterium]
MKNLTVTLFLVVCLCSLPCLGQGLSLVVPTGHGDTPNDAMLSPDGKYAATWDLQHAILWDVETGRQLRTWTSKSLNAGLFFLPDGKSFVGPVDGTYDRRIYDLPTLQPRAEKFVAPQNEIIFSSDGKYFAYSTYKGDAYVAPINSLRLPILLKQKITDKPNTSISFLTVSSGFKYIAIAGSRNTVDIWRFDPNATQRELLPILSFPGSSDGLWAGAFSPEEDRLVVSDRQRRLICYSISQQKMLWTVPLNTNSVAFTADGKKILAAQEKAGITELDATTGAILRTVYRPQKSLYRLRVVAPNRILFTGEDSEAVLLNYPQGDVLQRFRARVDRTPELAALPGKNQVLMGQIEKPSRLWDFTAGKLSRTLNPIGLSPFVNASANTAVMLTDGAFELLNLNDFSKQKLSGVQKISYSPDFVVAPNGKTMLMWDRSGKVVLHDLARGTTIREFNPWNNEELYLAAFSQDGQAFALTMVERNEVKVFRSADGRELKTLTVKMARGVSFLPDGRLVVDGDSRINVFDQNFQPQRSIPLPTRVSLSSFYWLPDGKRALIKLMTEDSNVMLVDFEKFEIVRRFAGHTNFVRALAMLPDGKHFVTTSFDNSTRVWNLNSSTSLAQLFSFKGSNDWVVATPDGRFDGSPGGIEQLYFVNGTQTIALAALYEKFYTPNLLPRLLQGEAQPAPNGVDDDIRKLKAPPIVKINPPGGLRNLTVEDDVTTIRRFNSTTDKITLTIEASCANDKVTEIRLFQNGKLVGSGTRNLSVVDDVPASQKTQTYEIQLMPGDNHFRAVALNSQRTESRPDEIIVANKTPVAKVAPPNTSTLHLLVVGINQYKNSRYNLNYATADATAFKAAVEAASVGLYASVNSAYVNDDKATRAGVVAALEKIKLLANPQDVFIFYYAGHGMMTEKNVFHLVPHDVTQMYGADDVMAQKGVSAGLLQQYSREIKAQKQLFILDACQSAAALNNVVALRGAAEEKAIAQLARSTGTHWLTATGSEQFASEFDQLGHGTFTYALLQALSGKADKGNDRKITVKEVDAYLQDIVPQLTAKYRGQPQYPASFGFGNDFPLGIVK